jgi:hypothetical protein
MSYDFQDVYVLIFDLLSGFYYSTFFLAIKILVGIYLFILLADIVMLLMLRNVPQNVRVGLKGMDMHLISKSKLQKRWDKVKSRLKSDNVSQYKVAIIEADAIAEEVLAGIGYKGANMAEKLQQVQPAHLDEHLEALKGAHEIRNRIVHEEDFALDHRMAVAVVGVYENFLDYLEFLS